MLTSFYRKILLAVAVLLAVSSSTGCADDIFTEGDRFYAIGMCDEAITSYLRSLFLHRDSPAAGKLCDRIARCYVEAGDVGRAVRFHSQAIAAALTDVERLERRFSLVETLLAGQRYQSAEKELDSLSKLSLTDRQRLRWQFLHGIRALYIYDWEKAFIFLSAYFAGTDTFSEETENKVLKLISFARHSWKPDPKAARAFSFILPGSGQMYAGDVPHGLNSLAVTGGTASLVVLTAATGDWPDALMLTYFVFLRFYLGSPYHAGRIALEKRKNRNQTVLQSILSWLTR